MQAVFKYSREHHNYLRTIVYGFPVIKNQRLFPENNS